LRLVGFEEGRQVQDLSHLIFVTLMMLGGQ